MPSKMPAGRQPVPQEAAVGTAAARSALVLKRFAYRVSVFAVFSGAMAVLGGSFVRQLASVALVSSIVLIVFGHAQRERVMSRSCTSFDEAVWFFLLSLILRACA